MDTVAPARWSTRIASRLDQDGYVRLPGALDPAPVEDLRDAVDGVWARHRAGSAPATLHLLAFLREDRRFVRLLDHRPVIDVVAEALGPTSSCTTPLSTPTRPSASRRAAGCGIRTAASRTATSRPRLGRGCR